MITLQASSIKHDNEEKRENKTRNRSKKQNKTSEIGIFLCHYRTINVKSNLSKTKLISELFGGLTGDDKKEVGIADKMNQHICSINKKTGQEHPSYKHRSRTIHRKEGIYTFRVLILWLKTTIYRVAAKFNTSKSCGPGKSQVCFLNWPSHTFLDVKSDVINQRLYFLATGKMPIFLQSECWQLQTDISRRESGAHVRTRIACVAGAWNLWRCKCNRDPLPVSATNNNNNSDNDNVMITIIIMIINYNNDRGFGFFRYMIPKPLPTQYSSLFECTPLAMTYAIGVNKYVLLLA